MSTKLKAPTTAGFNAIGKNQYKMMNVDEIIIDPEISAIFKIDEKLLEQITQSIIENGYDESQPVVLQKGTDILADGHTRRQAAKNAGLEKIPVVHKEFASRDDLLLYAYERQSKRRNLSSSEILKAAQLVLNTKKAANGEGRTLDAFAERLGIGARTLSQAKTILKEGIPEIIGAVKEGKMSTKKAFKETRKLKNPDNNQEVKTVKIDINSHIPFLKIAIVHLAEKEQITAVDLLVNYFLRENDRKDFYNDLPEETKGAIQLVYPVH